jgi:hypothetical protein
MGPVAFVCAETFRKHRSFLWLLAQAASAIFFRGTGILTQDLVLESLQKPFFCDFFSSQGLTNNLPELASNCNPPDFCLLRSY